MTLLEEVFFGVLLAGVAIIMIFRAVLFLASGSEKKQMQPVDAAIPGPRYGQLKKVSFQYIEESSVHNLCVALNQRLNESEHETFRILGASLDFEKKYVLLEVLEFEKPTNNN